MVSNPPPNCHGHFLGGLGGAASPSPYKEKHLGAQALHWTVRFFPHFSVLVHRGEGGSGKTFHSAKTPIHKLRGFQRPSFKLLQPPGSSYGVFNTGNCLMDKVNV